MDEYNEKCAICHENMNIIDDNNEMYELPECKHYFHTNCILTWFRSGHNSRVPLYMRSRFRVRCLALCHNA